MKKFIIVISSVLALSIGACLIGYHSGTNVSRETITPVTASVKTMFSNTTSTLVDKDGNEYKTGFVFPQGETYKALVSPNGTVSNIEMIQ